MKVFLVIVGCCLWWQPVETTKEECERVGPKIVSELKNIFKANPDISYRCVEK